MSCENVEMVWNSVPEVIEGTDKVEDLKVKNTKTGEETVIIGWCVYCSGNPP